MPILDHTVIFNIHFLIFVLNPMFWMITIWCKTKATTLWARREFEHHINHWEWLAWGFETLGSGIDYDWTSSASVSIHSRMIFWGINQCTNLKYENEWVPKGIWIVFMWSNQHESKSIQCMLLKTFDHFNLTAFIFKVSIFR